MDVNPIAMRFGKLPGLMLSLFLQGLAGGASKPLVGGAENAGDQLNYHFNIAICLSPAKLPLSLSIISVKSDPLAKLPN